MGNVLRQSLAVVVCLVVLLPPGWCCFVNAGCGRKTPATLGERQSPDCCQCCSREPTPADDSPTAPTCPVGPRKPCCGEPQPGDRPNQGRRLLDLPAPAALLQVSTFVVTLVAQVGPEPQSVVFSPQRHLLNCVWLC
jgi:hypothetical protein